MLSAEKGKSRPRARTKNKISISDRFCGKMEFLALPLIGFIAAINQCEMQICLKMSADKVVTRGNRWELLL